jgi:cytochrome bd ubiquinol oxidase subunit I
MDDVLFLSRLQFALTIMFHYLFPPFSIGLGALLVLMEGTYLRTGREEFHRMAKFWTKIFALNFAIGVATGIVMEFEFGTNWAVYSRFVGDVFGSALAAEGIFAFFLESGFLAVLVFGWDRVSPRMHFFSTTMVFAGSVFSAVWIVIANSWQQTPAGFHIVGDGMSARAEITDFWAMIFNPSSMHRLGHVILGSFLQGAFFVSSICAFYLLRRRHQAFARKGLGFGLGFAGVSVLAIFVSGHAQADKVAETQPAKLAAFEGHFRTGPAPLYLAGWPDVEAQKTQGLAVPGGVSFLVEGDFGAELPGLDQFSPEDQPPVRIPFVTYHLMVGAGVLMFLLCAAAGIQWFRGRLFDVEDRSSRFLLRALVPAVLLPILANQSGWVAAEVGRQPWIVYGLLRTSDGLSQAVTAEMVLTSIIMFGVIYALLFAVWVFVLNEKIQHGPEEAPVRGESGPKWLDVAAAGTDPAGPSFTGAGRGG